MLNEDIRFEVEKCSRCEICWNTCPAYISTGEEAFTPQGKIETAGKMLNEVELQGLENDAAYQCSLCSACEQACLIEVKVTEIVKYLRLKLDELGRTPKRFKYMFENIMSLGSVLRESSSARTKWLEGDIKLTPNAETLYLTGCVVAYRLGEVARSTSRILNHAGLDFTILGEKEKCCGLTFLEFGKIEEVEKLAIENINRIEEAGVKRVIVSCASCYDMYKNFYPKIYRKPKFEVEHISQTIYRLIKNGGLKLGGKSPRERGAFKDPCHLARASTIYGEPREVLKSIDGVELVEFEANRAEAICCGAPTIRLFSPETANKIGETLIREAATKKVSTIITSCPFCYLHLKNIAEKLNLGVKVEELPNYVYKHLARVL